MIDEEHEEDRRSNRKRERPGGFDTVGEFQLTRDHHQNALAENRGRPVEGTPDTDERGLLALLQSKHVETVGGNIVPITSFTYQNVGITVQIEPRVHHNKEITLTVQVEISSISSPLPERFQARPMKQDVSPKHSDIATSSHLQCMMTLN